MPASPVARLLVAALESPADLSRRLVLADALLERGDVRGEFITLQVRRLEGADPRPTRREQSLAKAHGEQWLGRLSKYLKAPRFEGGFVSAGTLLDVPFAADDASWPEWASLTSLTRAAKQNPVPLLAGAKLVSLRAVDKLTVGELVEVTNVRGVLPYTTVGLRCAPFAAQTPNTLAGLRSRLPALTTLTLTYPDSSMGSMAPYFNDLKPFLTSKVFAALRQLSLGLESERELNLMLEHAARSKLERLTCHVQDSRKPVVVDLVARRIEVPGELTDVEAPRGFALVSSGLSKAALRAQRALAERELIGALREAEEADLAWRLEFKQPMTRKMQALVEALRAGECTPQTIDAWKAAHEKPAQARRRAKSKR